MVFPEAEDAQADAAEDVGFESPSMHCSNFVVHVTNDVCTTLGV